MSTPEKILAVVGPTASGKTSLAIKLAKKFGGEIVSADSRQIYRGMDLGTAKPTKKEMAGIKHYIIDIKYPDEDYTVAEYKKEAVAAIKKIIKGGKLPILIGGTGLYVKTIVENLEIPNVAADEKLRKKLESNLQESGLRKLFQKLVDLDPEAAYIVDPKNPRRVMRALEVAIKTGKPFSAQRKTGKRIFNALQIGIKISKEKLNKKIDARVEQMIKAGLINEVDVLLKKYGRNVKALEAIGYREIIDFLEKKTVLAAAIEEIKKNTRNYAKRQITWFKKDNNICWVKTYRAAEKIVKQFLSNK